MWTPLELVCVAGAGVVVACAITVGVALWRGSRPPQLPPVDFPR